jgi:hypothetical protein
MCSKNIEILDQQQIIGPVKLRFFPPLLIKNLRMFILDCDFDKLCKNMNNVIHPLIDMNNITINNYAFSTRIIIIKSFGSILDIFSI